MENYINSHYFLFSIYKICLTSVKCHWGPGNALTVESNTTMNYVEPSALKGCRRLWWKLEITQKQTEF